jgi:hypothetical protein
MWESHLLSDDKKRCAVANLKHSPGKNHHHLTSFLVLPRLACSIIVLIH